MSPPPTLTVLTDARTGAAHLVAPAAVAAGRRVGCYAAVCGLVVVAASLTAPTGRLCSTCARVTR